MCFVFQKMLSLLLRECRHMLNCFCQFFAHLGIKEVLSMILFEAVLKRIRIN
uniref:Uncharacterized protein n=1 Tax=Arundo donax TaxID=35708 RepID=A0A0A9AR50_ARUDO